MYANDQFKLIDNEKEENHSCLLMSYFICCVEVYLGAPGVKYNLETFKIQPIRIEQ